MILLALWLGCAPKPAPPLPPPAPPPVPEYTPASPAPLAARPFSVPPIAPGSLPGGTPVLVVENHEVPFVSVSISFPSGAVADPAGKAGVASATLDLLMKGAGKRDALAISAEIRRLGGSVSTGAGYDGSAISFSCLRDRFEPMLDLVAEMLLRPTFPATEWDQQRKLWLDDLAEARKSPNRLAPQAMDRLVWGALYRGVQASPESLARITAKDLRRWHAEHLRLREAQVLVGGDITLAEVVPLLAARFPEARGAASAAPLRPPVPATVDKTTVYLLDRAGAAQSVLRGHAPAGKPTDADFAAFSLANMAMGGQFASRLNLDLREKLGFTYGIRSSVSFDAGGSAWSLSSGIHTEKTGEAIAAILADLQAAATTSPFTSAEIDAARGALLGGYPLRFETPEYLLGQVQSMRTYGLPGDWVTGYPERIARVSAEDAEKAWVARVNPDKLRLLVVGDAARIRPDIEKLGIAVVPVDSDGHVVGAK